MKKFSLIIAISLMTSRFCLAGAPGVDRRIQAPEEAGDIIVYPAIGVTVNKSIVIQLARRATRVSIMQPQIADVTVVAPNQILVTGKAIGSTSLIVWLEPAKTR